MILTTGSFINSYFILHIKGKMGHSLVQKKSTFIMLMQELGPSECKPMYLLLHILFYFLRYKGDVEEEKV
jgi:hypothetical protein